MELSNEINGMLQDVSNIVSKHLCKMVVKMNETRKAEEECLELIKNIQFQIKFGKAIRLEKKEIKKKVMDLAIPYSMRIRNIQVQSQLDITKMVRRF